MKLLYILLVIAVVLYLVGCAVAYAYATDNIEPETPLTTIIGRTLGSWVYVVQRAAVELESL